MAHGEMLMLGSYTTYAVQIAFERWLPGEMRYYLLAAVPLSFLSALLAGVILERAVHPLPHGRPLETLLATWGISLALMQTVRLLFGAQNVAVANPALLSGGMEVAHGLVLPYSRVAVIFFALIVTFAVWALLQRTRLGLQVRAVTQNRSMAACLGISTARIDMWMFGLGSGIAGLGGVALSQIGNVGPDLGQTYIIDSFMVVVVGGVGRLAGSIVASLGLGLLDEILEPFVGAVLGKIAVLALIILFIQRRPQGLFTLKRAHRGLSMLGKVRGRLLVMHSSRAWFAVLLSATLLLVALPLANGLVPANSALHVPDYSIPLLGKFLCFGLSALAVDLIWGFAGILSLGHGLFFALGGYAMGMYLMRSIAGEGVYRSALPDFMVFLDWKTLPWYWRGFDSFPYAVAAALVGPALVALVFGFFAFRSRSGCLLLIVTQAFTYAAMLLFFQNAAGFGGNNGLTDFKHFLGHPLRSPSTRLALYLASGVALLLGYVACRYIITSKLGRVLTAIRDAELKARFCGYETTHYKLFVWTFSAILCALAGALYVPQVGIINPSEMQPSNSIEMAIWVAVGGRGSLAGAVLGAWLINGGKSWLTAAFPSSWLYVLGALFILVTLFLPEGIAGTWSRLMQRRSK